MFTGASASDGVSRLGLDRETCLETRFLESRSRRSVMALGHYMREIESGSAGTAGKTRKGGKKQGKKPKGESRNK